MGRLTAPAPLDAAHVLSGFDCGKEPLNDWLKRRALRSEGRSARCFVIAQDGAVVGYYVLAAGAVERAAMPKKLQRSMPNSVPVVIVARMAIDLHHQGQRIGAALLKDALLRIANASREIGARAVVVHAIDDEVVPFYRNYGFEPLPGEARTLFLPIETIAAAL